MQKAMGEASAKGVLALGTHRTAARAKLPAHAARAAKSHGKSCGRSCTGYDSEELAECAGDAECEEEGKGGEGGLAQLESEGWEGGRRRRHALQLHKEDQRGPRLGGQMLWQVVHCSGRRCEGGLRELEHAMAKVSRRGEGSLAFKAT